GGRQDEHARAFLLVGPKVEEEPLRNRREAKNEVVALAERGAQRVLVDQIGIVHASSLPDGPLTPSPPLPARASAPSVHATYRREMRFADARHARHHRGVTRPSVPRPNRAPFALLILLLVAALAGGCRQESNA